MSDELKLVVVRRDVYYHEVAYVRGLERLAEALLLFHHGGPWTAEDAATWRQLTGRTEATTKALCDFARSVIKQEDVVWDAQDLNLSDNAKED